MAIDRTSKFTVEPHREAGKMIAALPRAKALLGDRGYDADWFRAALAERKITACIPSKKNRKVPIPHDTALYRQRHKIENMFGRLKDWRRVHTRYDRCAHTLASPPFGSCPPSPSPRLLSSGSINEP